MINGALYTLLYVAIQQDSVFLTGCGNSVTGKHVIVQGDNNLIVGSSIKVTGDANVVSNNDVLTVSVNGSQNTIYGNVIAGDSSSGYPPLYVWGSGNVVSQNNVTTYILLTDDALGNAIEGNTADVIMLFNGTANNRVVGNTIAQRIVIANSFGNDIESNSATEVDETSASDIRMFDNILDSRVAAINGQVAAGGSLVGIRNPPPSPPAPPAPPPPPPPPPPATTNA